MLLMLGTRVNSTASLISSHQKNRIHAETRGTRRKQRGKEAKKHGEDDWCFDFRFFSPRPPRLRVNPVPLNPPRQPLPSEAEEDQKFTS